MNFNHKNCVSPILRRVFSRPTLYVQPPSSHQYQITGAKNNNNELLRSESRVSTVSSSAGTKSGDLLIDITTEENVQFMDQPLRGKIELSGLPATVESVKIALKGVVKTCVAGKTSGFGGDSNVTARFNEKEILKQELTLHPCTQPATPLSPDRRHTLPFVFLFPVSSNLPPSMTFPQGLGSIEYTLHVTLKGKKKFGSAKKWTSTLVLKVEISRRAIGARLETMAISDAIIAKTNHKIMLEHPRIMLPGYTNHYFTLHFPQGLLQIHTFEATLVQRSFYKALGGNYRGTSTVELVCRVGQAEANIREAGMERVHVEIEQIGDEALESSVEVDAIIERKHFFRVEVSVVMFKHGVEKIHFELPVVVQCAAVPASHADRRGTMSSMTSASSSHLPYLASDPTATIRSSRSIGHFRPPARTLAATPANFDASPPLSPTDLGPTSLGRTRMNSKTWRENELPGLMASISTPQLQSPVKLEPQRTRYRQRRNWTLVKPGMTTPDSVSAPTPPPTCPIPDIPPPAPAPGSVAPIIPPRRSSRLAGARQIRPAPRSRTNSTVDELGRRTSQDTMTTSSVTSSPSDCSGRLSTTSTAATSVSSSPGETYPLKTRGVISLRKVEEMGSWEPLHERFDTTIFRAEAKGEIERREFQRRIEFALSEVEKLALEESDAECSDIENEVLRTNAAARVAT